MAAVFSFWGWLGRGPAMCEVVWVGVRGGEQFAWAAFGGRGRSGLGFLGCAQPYVLIWIRYSTQWFYPV